MSNKASGTVIILITVEKVIYFYFLSFVVNHVSSTSVQIYEHICVFLGLCVCHCQNGFWRQLEIHAPAALPRLLDIFRRSGLTNGQPRNMTI